LRSLGEEGRTTRTRRPQPHDSVTFCLVSASSGPPSGRRSASSCWIVDSEEGCAMKDQIDCRCQSGEYVRFALFKEGRPLSPMAGNYMYVREEGDTLAVLYLGETDNL